MDPRIIQLVADFLHSKGFDIDQDMKYPPGPTILHYAMSRKFHNDLVELLIAIRPEYIEEKTSCGNTPLYWAAEYNNVEGARILLRHGANVNTKCEYGKTPMARAIFYNHTEMIEYLRMNGGHE